MGGGGRVPAAAAVTACRPCARRRACGRPERELCLLVQPLRRAVGRCAMTVGSEDRHESNGPGHADSHGAPAEPFPAPPSRPLRARADTRPPPSSSRRAFSGRVSPQKTSSLLVGCGHVSPVRVLPFLRPSRLAAWQRGEKTGRGKPREGRAVDSRQVLDAGSLPSGARFRKPGASNG